VNASPSGRTDEPCARHAREGRLWADGDGWVDVKAAAAYLDVAQSFVYEHAAELGGRRLGTGPKGRWRFKFSLIDEALTCFTGRESETPETPMVEPVRRRRTPPPAGTRTELLPVRGEKAA
jgi:hypothetical protein